MPRPVTVRTLRIGGFSTPKDAPVAEPVPRKPKRRPPAKHEPVTTNRRKVATKAATAKRKPATREAAASKRKTTKGKGTK